MNFSGISMLTLTPGIAEELRQRSSRYSSVEGGVFVASVSRGSPADRLVSNFAYDSGTI